MKKIIRNVLFTAVIIINSNMVANQEQLFAQFIQAQKTLVLQALQTLPTESANEEQRARLEKLLSKITKLENPEPHITYAMVFWMNDIAREVKELGLS